MLFVMFTAYVLRKNDIIAVVLIKIDAFCEFITYTMGEFFILYLIY